MDRVSQFLLSAGTVLSIGSINDGEYLKRSGSTIVSVGGGNRVFAFEFDGRGLVIDPTTIPQAVLPFAPLNGTIIECYVKDLDDLSGDCTIDIRAAARSGASPGPGDSLIGGGTKPGTSSSNEGTLSSFGTWSSVAVALNAEFRAVILTNTVHKHLMLFVTVQPS